MAEELNKLQQYFKALGAHIAQFRKERGFSLEELGLRIGIDRSAMHRIENGKPISVNTVIKLALALDKTPVDFFAIGFDLKSTELGGLVNSRKSPKRKKLSKKAKSKKKR